MPQFIERPDLPPALISALTSPSYITDMEDYLSSLPADLVKSHAGSISVTTLNKSPRQRILLKRHEHRVFINPLDNLYALLGSVVHSILEKHAEKNPEAIIEKRIGKSFETSRGSWWLNGQFDIIEDKRLTDYKFTSAYSLMYGGKEDYIAQLNVLRYLAIANGYEVESLSNCYIFRDWSAREVEEGSLYPKERAVQIDIPIWTNQSTEDYIMSRLESHAAFEDADDDDLPFCLPRERWEEPTRYKGYKLAEDGSPQARAKFTTESQMASEDLLMHLIEADRAAVLAKNDKLKKPKPESELKFSKFTIKQVKGRAKKCDFCLAASFCNQRKAEIAEIMREQEELNSVPQ